MMSGFFFRGDWGLGAAVAVAFALEAALFSFESPVILRDGRIALLQPPGSVGSCLALRCLRRSLQYLLLPRPRLALLFRGRRVALDDVWMVFIQVLADAEAVGVAGRVEHHEVGVGELISEVVEIEKAQVRERRNLQVSQTVDETKNWRSTP